MLLPLFFFGSLFFFSHFLNIINNSNMVLELVHIGVGYTLKLTNINSNAIHNRCRHSSCQCHHHPIIYDVFICIYYHFRPMLQPLSDHSSCSLAIVCCWLLSFGITYISTSVSHIPNSRCLQPSTNISFTQFWEGMLDISI